MRRVEKHRSNECSYDYTKGKLGELVDIIIESGCKLFVSAVGVPPKEVVDKLHKNGVFYMNMIGHPKHVPKCLALGVDLICAQGGEGGGHTGDVPTSVLIPTVANMCKGKTSPMSGKPVQVVAAGGIFNGQSLASAMALGATAVWVGTRFILTEVCPTMSYKGLLDTNTRYRKLAHPKHTRRPFRHQALMTTSAQLSLLVDLSASGEIHTSTIGKRIDRTISRILQPRV